MRHLRWLTLLAILGSLGRWTGHPALSGLYGFMVFLPLFWYDERTEAVFKQAATTAFIATMFALAGTFAYLVLTLQPDPLHSKHPNLATHFVIALMVVYLTQLAVFVLAYAYYDRRGFRS